MRSEAQLAIGCMVDTACVQLFTMAPALDLQDLNSLELRTLETNFSEIKNIMVKRLDDIVNECKRRELAVVEALERGDHL